LVYSKHTASPIESIIESLGLARQLLIDQPLSHTGCRVAEMLNQVNSVNSKAVSISLIAYSQLKRSVNIALLPVASYIQIMLARSLIRESVDKPGVRVEVKDYWFVGGEDGLPPLV
jgi:hypothetical protein